MQLAPVFRDIVLVGGGHAHALVIRMWAMNPLPGARLTLISPQAWTPYSGMLPGLLAGHYRFEETHIDLGRLCAWAGVRFIQAEVTALDPARQTLSLSDGRPPIGYDALSLDIGSTPDTSIPGAADHAVPVKPVSRFHRNWQRLEQALDEHGTHGVQQMVLVGGGAGSVELVLAMAHRLRARRDRLEFHLCTRAPEPLQGYPARLVDQCRRALGAEQIELHTHFAVQQVEATHLISERSETLPFDHLIWCTHARGADWVAASGLDCDQQGFVKVGPTLQSLNYPNIFAAGDIAAMVASPRPKAGVYAVRQGKYLFENLRRFLLEQPLKPYRPQDGFLSLIALGGKTALGSKNGFSFQGDWVWRWKDHIDRKFMARFQELPTLTMSRESAPRPALIPGEDRQDLHQPAIRCAGCGAKVGALLLAEVLEEISGKPFSAEDAAEIQLPDSRIFQSTDFLKTPVDDPYLFGRIATVHALSDLFARGATPHSVQMTLVLPYAGRRVQKRELRQLLTAVQETLAEHDCLLTGGHSAEGAELALGFSVIGTAGAHLKGKTGLEIGQKLLLSKPLGTGVLLAALMRGLTQGAEVQRCLQWMATSNATAAQRLSQDASHACTDITGFGFLGHLYEMLGDDQRSVHLDLDRIPLLDGALRASQAGVRSSLYPHNLDLVLARMQLDQTLMNHPMFELLLDPQTSGGLLAGVEPKTADRLVQQYPDAFWCIGEVCPAGAGQIQRL